jgi:hypothetical protein
MSLLSMALAHRPDQAALAGGLLAFGCAFWIVFLLVLMAFPVFCFWRIFTKAGYAGAMALIWLIPGVGPLIVICILAFGEWPIHKH